ncbi:MAG: hypothetical protein ACOCXP_00445 [Candidatus Dojkabacteria bacterium]
MTLPNEHNSISGQNTNDYASNYEESAGDSTNGSTNVSTASSNYLNKKSKAGRLGQVLGTVFSTRNVMVTLSLLSATLGALFYMTYQENRELEGSVAGAVANEDFQRIVGNVRELVEIGEDERVNVALVDDPQLLLEENPVFYRDVQAGHYLIVMPESQRVIIYDDDQKRIVNFSSYTIRVEKVAEEEIPAAEKPLTIELRYTSGVLREDIEVVSEALSSASSNYLVVSTVSTSNLYEGVSVVLQNREEKPNMSQNLIADVGSNQILDELPTGEEDSEADVVIIVGEMPE